MPVRPLSLELSRKAQSELLEDPKKLENGIQHLKDWISKQPHLRARTDLYYSLRSIAPDINCLKPKDPKFMEILKAGFVLALPKTTDPLGPRIILLRGGMYDPLKYSHFEVMSVFHVLQQILYMEDDNYVVSGALNIMDFKGTSFAHFAQLTPVRVKQMVIAYKEALPIRMKGAHFLNTPKAFETIFSIAKSLLDKKTNSRILMHKDYETLHMYIPKEVLPAEYGGDGGALQNIIDYWVKKVEDYSVWLEQDQQFGTDEKLRAGSPKTAAAMFGVEGSFRQLDFD